VDGDPFGHDPHGPCRRRTAAAFGRLARSGELDLPLPGGGRTRQRFELLARLAERDLGLVRLAEGHADALAILAELGGPRPEPGSRWGVWAARPPDGVVTATRGAGGWRLRGTKRYCSGARSCTHALVTATAPDGERLFVMPVGEPGVTPLVDGWPAAGMAGSDTLDLDLDCVPAVPLGPPGAYPDRAGFWHGGIGVAACWYGGATATARPLLEATHLDAHGLAHLGAVDVVLTATRAVLVAAADAIDADPRDLRGGARRRAMRARALVERTGREVLDRVGRALGPAPLGRDAGHAQRVADLTVYLRQHHAERDLAALGTDLATGQGNPW
jgi:alkylation response protein AidB-like acyl-CoA dehydrogenase